MADIAGDFEVLENRLLRAWLHRDARELKALVSGDCIIMFGTTPPVLLDPVGPIGRVDIVWLDEQNLAVSWMARADYGAYLKVIRLQNGKVSGEAVTVTNMSESRRSGFPQMVLMNGQLIFAWTEVGEINQVKMATLGASAL